MIAGFNRTISLPTSPWQKVRAPCHVRSVSLPSRSHPLISSLEEQIRAVQSWAASSDSSLAWIEAALSQLELLHLALNNFLNLSHTKNVLQRSTASTEHLLNNLLHLVDSYGSLVSAIVTLKQQQFEVQSAFRRHDTTFLASSIKSQRRTEKELSQLVSSLRTATKFAPLELASDDTEAEIVAILREAICATSAASVVIFNRVVASNSSASSRVALFVKKGSKEERKMVVFEKLEELEECVRIVESGSEKVFRSLVNSRVSLLNIQSDSF